MPEARVDRSQLYVPVAALLAAGLLFGPLSASAQSNAPVHVYHSLDSQGADPRAESPMGCAGGNVLVNGDFEAGTLTGWRVDSRNLSSGAFFAENGSVTPVSESSSAGPKSGSYYAVSDQDFEGEATHVLSQEFYIPPGAQEVIVSFDMFVNNWGGETVINEGVLDHDVEGSNQFAVVELVTSAGFALDPYTRLAASVINTFYIGADQPLPGSPHPYTSYNFDITSWVTVGGTFVLRFAETSNLGPLNLGVDNVSITTPWGNCVIRGRAGEQIELWLNGGPGEGLPEPSEYLCKMGEDGSSGDQLCGAELLLALEGIGELTSFEPAPSGMETLVYRPECLGGGEGEPCSLPSGTKQLRLNFTRGALAPAALPRYLGRVTLDSTGVTPETETAVKARGFAAGAQLQLRPIGDPINPVMIASSKAIPVPEPVHLLQLLCGVLGLRLLERRRR